MNLINIYVNKCSIDVCNILIYLVLPSCLNPKPESFGPKVKIEQLSDLHSESRSIDEQDSE